MRDSEEEKSKDATLSNLTVDGEAVEGFAAETLEYNVKLEVGTTEVPAVVATVTATDKANAVVTPAESLPGTTEIVVTAEDGTTTKTYKINFTVAVDPTAGATAELAKITNEKVTTVPYGTENTKEAIEAAMLELANAAVAEGYTVTIAEGSNYIEDTKVWAGKFVVTEDATPANTKTDAVDRNITVIIATQSSDATVKKADTAEESYVIAHEANTITGVPAGTVADLKEDILVNDANATLKVTDAAGTEITVETTALATGQKVVVTAEDGTVKTYEITLA